MVPLCLFYSENTSIKISTVKSIFFQMQKIPNLQMDANKNTKSSLESATGKASLQPPDGASGKMLKVVFVSLLLDLIAFAMILPLFPVLLDYYGRKDQVYNYRFTRSITKLYSSAIRCCSPNQTRTFACSPLSGYVIAGEACWSCVPPFSSVLPLAIFGPAQHRPLLSWHQELCFLLEPSCRLLASCAFGI